MTLAHCEIIGRLARDPETKQTAQGLTITRFAVAVDARKKDDPASFFDCTAFGKTAEIVKQFWTKGKPIIITGELRQERWEDKEGQKRSKISVVAERVSFVPRDSTEGQSGAPRAESAPAAGGGASGLEDEPPF